MFEVDEGEGYVGFDEGGRCFDLGRKGQRTKSRQRRDRRRRFCFDLFLPSGFPHSVTEDYLTYQAWDTVQALCSYLRGLLCTQALLLGVGVGRATASATNATLNWIFRDGAGMLGGMLFTYANGMRLGWDVKQYRFFADLINDVGLTLELLSPLWPEYFTLFAVTGSVCRALCGVAAGATRAGLMVHFARDKSQVADLSAKEGMQETAVTLIGLSAGLACTSYLDGAVQATWVVFIALTLIHLWANWCGLRALHLRSFNRARLGIVVGHFLDQCQLAVLMRTVKLPSARPPPLWLQRVAILCGREPVDALGTNAGPASLLAWPGMTRVDGGTAGGGAVASPAQVNKCEPIFAFNWNRRAGGRLWGSGSWLCGRGAGMFRLCLGVPFARAAFDRQSTQCLRQQFRVWRQRARSSSRSASVGARSAADGAVQQRQEGEPAHLLSLSADGSVLFACLHASCSRRDVLFAVFHASVVEQLAYSGATGREGSVLPAKRRRAVHEATILCGLAFAFRTFDQFYAAAVAAGWHVDELRFDTGGTRCHRWQEADQRRALAAPAMSNSSRADPSPVRVHRHRASATPASSTVGRAASTSHRSPRRSPAVAGRPSRSSPHRREAIVGGNLALAPPSPRSPIRRRLLKGFKMNDLYPD